MTVKLAVIYYSSTGTVHAMAQRITEAGQKAGAEVRLRQVPELAPQEAIASNAAWSQHFDRTKDEPRPPQTTSSGPTPCSSAPRPATGTCPAS